MKIVIAPDSYKESLSAQQAAEAVAEGFRQVLPLARYVLLPMADGGEGTVDALIAATGGRKIPVAVTGPLGEEVEAFFGLSGDGQTAVVEMAAASGLALVPPAQRNPLRTTTYGTGQLIAAALESGARRLILGIGGSATTDGGAGMLQALGVRLLDAAGKDIAGTGAGLALLDRLDASGLDPRLARATLDVPCDVDNPLCGPRGAAAVFGPQKGADQEMVARLDANLERFARILRRDLGADVAQLPGAGAAGGMGAAMLGVLRARLRPGVDIVMEAVNLEEAVRDADLVVTGEGRMDGQTAFGKTPVGVARVAKRHGCPVIGIAGCLLPDVTAVYSRGIDAVFSVLCRPCGLEDALREGAANLRFAARNIAALFALRG